MMQSLSNTVICLDLDDTLYKEIDFLKSAYKEVATYAGYPEAASQMLEWHYAKENVFQKLIETYGLLMTVADCLNIYRNHYPDISLEIDVKEFLIDLKDADAKLGLISDGRSITQRNKIKALGIEDLFDIIVISEEFGSEKPDERNYRIVMEKYPERSNYVYIADNPSKDFVSPNYLGWRTVCILDDGRNIHKQDFKLSMKYQAQFDIVKIKDLSICL